MTNKEKLELNRIGLIKEYKILNTLFNKKPSMEVSCRMSDIYLILINKYHMSASEVEALEF